MTHRYDKALDKCLAKIKQQHPDWNNKQVEDAGYNWLKGVILKDGGRPQEVVSQLKRNVTPHTIKVMPTPHSETEQELIKENERLTTLCDRLESELDRYIARYGKL